MPNIRWLLALITAIHRFVYRVSGGRIGRKLGGVSTLLLSNVGRKTGRERITPLLYVEDEAGLIVVASNAGDDRPPAWWLNLKSHPETEVQVGRDRCRVRARRATDEETPRLWLKLEAEYRHFTGYRRRANREIPIVVLERLS